MTNEQKQLLIIDLCARLPYGVIVDNPNPAGGAWDEVINVETFTKTVTLLYNGRVFSIDDIKLYLRPMSSMTEEEEREVRILWNEDFADKTSLYHCYPKTTDFYNKHHLDYRGLIPMGLALEAPKDMYKIE